MNFLKALIVSASFIAPSSHYEEGIRETREAWFSIRGVASEDGEDCDSLKERIGSFEFTPRLNVSNRSRIDVENARLSTRGCHENGVIFAIDFALSFDVGTTYESSLDVSITCGKGLRATSSILPDSSGVYRVALSEVEEKCGIFHVD